MKTQISVKMSSQLKRNLDASYTVGVPLRDFLQEATSLIRDEARDEAPVDIGKMRDSHVAIVDKAPIPGWGRMEVQAVSAQNAPYPLFVHEGTKPHFPPVSAIEGWANRHGIDPFVLARSISRKGTRPNPWLERTLNRVKPRLLDLGKLSTYLAKQWNKS